MSPVFSDYSHGLFMISLIFHKVIKFLLIYQIGSEKEQKIFSCFALNFHKFIHPWNHFCINSRINLKGQVHPEALITSCWSWLGSWSVSAFRCRPTKGSRVLQITNHCWTGTYFSKNSIRMHDESHLFLIEKKKKNVLKYDLKLLNNNDFCLIYMKHNL